jgi:hypothetical protein
LAELVTNAFVGDPNIAVNTESFEVIFGSPFLRKELNVRAVHVATGQIVGFLGTIQRDVYYQGETSRFVILTLLAVSKNHRRKGLAYKMHIKMLEASKLLGVEGGFAVYEPEEHGIDASEKLARETNIKMRRILNINTYIFRVFDVKKAASVARLSWMKRIALGFLKRTPQVEDPAFRKYHPEDGEQVFALMRDHLKENEMSVIHRKDDFLWHLKHPCVLCVVHENDQKRIDGFMIARRLDLSGFGNTQPCGWIDCIHMYRLSEKYAVDLCRCFSFYAKGMGWIGIQTPYNPYFESKPFRKAGFLFYRKRLWVNVFLLKDVFFPDQIKRFYIDLR